MNCVIIGHALFTYLLEGRREAGSWSGGDENGRAGKRTDPLDFRTWIRPRHDTVNRIRAVTKSDRKTVVGCRQMRPRETQTGLDGTRLDKRVM